MFAFHLHRLFACFLLSGVSLGLASCAGGPTYAEIQSKLPPLAKGRGRVFVYRPSAGAFAIKPWVKIDDQKAGISKAQGFFYSDQPPGTHAISISTEWKHKNTLSVVAGQPTFVECMVLPGVLAAHIIPNQVETAKGQAAIQECKTDSDEFSEDEDETSKEKPKAETAKIRSAPATKSQRARGDS
ncbi:MAG: hypothetical protein JWO94_556 [Verrucomicrobiaceae bacterium]|nr:hypothetical protein [Verrucomicrobiaceae bacterium]